VLESFDIWLCKFTMRTVQYCKKLFSFQAHKRVIQASFLKCNCCGEKRMLLAFTARQTRPPFSLLLLARSLHFPRPSIFAQGRLVWGSCAAFLVAH
jgi:hypothetical protein